MPHHGHHNEEAGQSESQQGHSANQHKRGTFQNKGHSKGIQNYSVWKGTPLSYTAQTLQEDRSPHINLKFDDGSGRTKQANINVASTDRDSRLVYWLNRQWHHPIMKGLTPLGDGPHPIDTSKPGHGLSLDFLRTEPKLIDLSLGHVVQDSQPGPNDILNLLEPILNDAINAQAKMYVFGADYGSGIDDIHMNQGSLPHFANAVGEDGAIIFHYTDGDAHYEAIFLAFASQSVPTHDETGAAEPGGTTLAELAQGTEANTARGGQ